MSSPVSKMVQGSDIDAFALNIPSIQKTVIITVKHGHVDFWPTSDEPEYFSDKDEAMRVMKEVICGN